MNHLLRIIATLALTFLLVVFSTTPSGRTLLAPVVARAERLLQGMGILPGQAPRTESREPAEAGPRPTRVAPAAPPASPSPSAARVDPAADLVRQLEENEEIWRETLARYRALQAPPDEVARLIAATEALYAGESQRLRRLILEERTAAVAAAASAPAGRRRP